MRSQVFSCRRTLDSSGGAGHRLATRRGFSLVEMLIALTISATLLTATLTAFHASWLAYKDTTESASTHVVSRIVMHRLQAMLRTASDFQPYPADVFDLTQNPGTSSWIEFTTAQDLEDGVNRRTRIERRDTDQPLSGDRTRFELWYVLKNGADDSILEERPLLTDLAEATFIVEYEPGPRLVRATIDLSIVPNDDADTRVGGRDSTPAIRLVASAVPRIND